MSIRWLYLDLNSFFASVEQELNPRLRGKPVAVVPMMADNTSVIAASYPAKAYGIKTGTRVGDAKLMCPGIVLIEANHEVYVEYHHRVIEAVGKCIPIAGVMSIDEVAAELRGSERKPERAIEIAQHIKQVLRTEVGSSLTASIGIAPNRYLAKIAADMQKPDGLTLIQHEDLPEKLKSLALRDFPGIGAQMEKRLRKAGVYNTEILLSLSREAMKQAWGSILGEHFFEWIRGKDTHQEVKTQKSISHSHVLAPERRTIEGAYQVLQKLLHKAAFRLRRANLWCRSISIGVRFLEQDEKFENKIQVIETQDDFALMQALKDLWKPLQSLERDMISKRPIKVGLVLHDLVPDQEHTLSLFGNERALQVSKKLDEINAKFGKGSIYFGEATKEIAPSRIAFTRIPDFDAD